MHGLVFQLSLTNKISISLLWIEMQTPLQRNCMIYFVFVEARQLPLSFIFPPVY